MTLLLAMTYQFETQISIARTREVRSAITGEYERADYEEIVLERAARARLRQAVPGACFKAYEEFLQALRWYERAAALRPAGNDDALLRWNTCTRTLASHPDLRPRPEEALEPMLDD